MAVEIIREVVWYFTDDDEDESYGDANYDADGNVEVSVRAMWQDTAFGEWHEITLPSEWLPYDKNMDVCLAWYIPEDYQDESEVDYGKTDQGS